MSASPRYLGARTAFGVIISVAECVHNPEAVVRAKDGSTRPYHLPSLIAHGLELATADSDTAVTRDQIHTRRCNTELPGKPKRRVGGVYTARVLHADPALNRSVDAKPATDADGCPIWLPA